MEFELLTTTVARALAFGTPLLLAAQDLLQRMRPVWEAGMAFARYRD